MSNIPSIDIHAIFESDATAKKRAAMEIGDMARDVGFFYVVNHGISSERIETTYAAAEAFFSQSEAFKMRYYIGNSRNHRGYVPFSEKGDYGDEVSRRYEAFDLGVDLREDDPDYLRGSLLLGPNVWPEMEGFKHAIYGYFTAISNVGRQLCEAFEIYLGLEKGAITQHMTKPVSQLRLLHYLCDPSQTQAQGVNMGAHTDYECLTLLHTRNEGLQIMDHGGHWLNVPVVPEAFVVNIGDMLEAWTNGIFRSTPHRVVNREVERFSMPYFVAANYDTHIAPFEQLATPQSAARHHYQFTAGEHLKHMLMRDFPYLRKRYGGNLPAGAKSKTAAHNPFENKLEGS